MPIWDNQMSIPNTSLTNPMPIQCQSYAITEDIPFSANLLPISKLSANPVPIGQSSANRPIRYQSYAITEAIPALNLGTSALYGEVSSLLGGRFRAKAPARTGASTQGLSTIAAHFLQI